MAAHMMNDFMRLITDGLIDEGEKAFKIINQRVTAIDDLLKSGKFDAGKIDFVKNGIFIPPCTSGQEYGFKGAAPHEGAGDQVPPASSLEKSQQTHHVLPGALFPTNENVVGAFDALKPSIRLFIEDCGKIHDWVSILTPEGKDEQEYEDAASKYEEVLDGLIEMSTDACELLDRLIWHFQERSEAVSKLVDYPQLDDAQKHVQELDEQAIFIAGKAARQTKALYIRMYNLVHKILK